MNAREPYPSDLTDDQWSGIEDLVPKPKPGGRPAKSDRREIVNGVLSVTRTGCQWRALPQDLPPWRSVSWDFLAWRDDGPLERVQDRLRSAVRHKAGRDLPPTAAVLDSPSVTTTESGRPKGYDPGTKVTGRKRHRLVATLGLILSVAVLPADVQDRDGAKTVLESLKAPFCWVQKVWADGAYAGQLVAWVAVLRSRRPVEWEIVQRSEEAVGFEGIATRWIVERTLGWLNRCRRLSKDDEATLRSAVAMIRLAMIHVMVRQLVPVTAF